MKHRSFVSSMLYTAPWAILAADFGVLTDLFQNYIKGTLPQLQEGVPHLLDEGDRVTGGIRYDFDAQSGICVISCAGIISKFEPDNWCGPQVIDLAELDSLIGEIAADDRVHTVVLYLNTPGGCMVGLKETAANLRELAALGKRLVAFGDYQVCSAGYYLACACDEVYASPSSIWGSIGTYMAALDSSRAFEMEGLELKLFKVGTLKAIGHPGKVWTKEEEQFLQETAALAGAQFKNWVVERRAGINDSTMQGQWFFAEDSPVGLVDGLRRDLPTLLAELMVADMI